MIEAWSCLNVIGQRFGQREPPPLRPIHHGFPRWCPQFADLREVLTLLKLLLTDTASNKGSAMSINTMSEELRTTCLVHKYYFYA